VLRWDEERTGDHPRRDVRATAASGLRGNRSRLANANAFYELGIRHAARPFTTVPIFANVSALPFDVALVHAVSYELENGKLTETSAQKLKSRLAKRLCDAISGATTDDSPLFQLIPRFPGIDLREVTKTFEDRIKESAEVREILSAARSKPTHEEKRERGAEQPSPVRF
jgi:hypothetical protein